MDSSYRVRKEVSMIPYLTRIEYIETGGNCLYTTSCIPQGGNIKISTKFLYNGWTSDVSWPSWYSAYTNENSQIYRVMRNGNSGHQTSVSNGGKGSGSVYDSQFTASVGTIYTIETNGLKVTVNGTQRTITRPIEPTANTSPMRIFHNYFKGRFYYMKIYDGDELILDLFPVRIGNKGYLYDALRNELIDNSLTGTPILGPDTEVIYANEVAFLESWGNQYIDTGIKPSTDTKIELKCLYCKSGAGLTNYGALIGADDRDNAYILNHSAVANFTYGLEFSNNFANPQTRLLTFDSTASPQNMRVYDEGGSLVTTLTCIRGVFEVNQNLYLFATNRSGTPVYGSNRILYCKIYDGDTLVRDYVPVEYNGIGYMYDKVSGLFFNNQGTGKFLFGSIAKACARSYSRRQLMSFKLPYDAEIEYLESTYRQYIDTGFTFKSNIRVVFSVIYTQTVTQYAQTWGLNRSGYEVLWGGGFFLFGGKKITYSNPVKDTEYEYDYDFTAGKMVAKINNTIVQSTSGTQPNASEAMYIFAMNGKGSRNYYKAKHGEFKLYKNGVISLDLIPVRVGNVGYMYDKVSGQLFGNSGTGSFILGPDKH